MPTSMLASSSPTVLRMFAESAGSGDRADARVSLERQDIRFWNETAGVVRIAITFRNLGSSPSMALDAQIEAAVLGAFVPWQDLSTVVVPALDPGEEATVEATARCPERVRPALATAGDVIDRRPLQVDARPLPDDPLRMMAAGGVHWAGNLNVLVGNRAVERHVARDLRVRPGRRNLAVLSVGGPEVDSYAFWLTGAGAAWEAGLHTGLRAGARPVPARAPLRLERWHELRGPAPLLLSIEPPAGAGAGEVQVHVEQASTGRTAVVEFALDPAAAGPGCLVS